MESSGRNLRLEREAGEGRKKELGDEMSALERDLEKNRGEFDSLREKKIRELGRIEDQLEEIRYVVNNRPQIELEIENKGLEREASQAELELEKKSRATVLQQQKEKMEEIEQFRRQQKENERQSGALREKLKQLNAQLLQLRSEWGIEEQLGKVLNKNRDISEFSQLVLQNIENKKEIMDELRRFDEEAGQMPGEVVEEERMGYNSQEIQESIEQQRKGFIDIQSKYLDIKADIEELGELKLEINRTVAKIQKVEDQIQELELAHGRLWDQIQPRNVELKNLNSRLHSLNLKIDELERRIGQLALDISGLREKLKNALATLNRLQSSRAQKEKYFRGKMGRKEDQKQKILSDLGRVEAGASELASRQLSLEEQISQLEREYDRKQRECFSILIYFLETDRALPLVNEEFARDQTALRRLKNEIRTQLSSVGELD